MLAATLSLHHLEEPGRGALSWAESMEFLEGLLAPACRPPHVLALDWRPGDYAIWDNRTVIHLVTATRFNKETGEPGYAALEERRLMTRTEMQSTWVPDRYPPGLRPKPQANPSSSGAPSKL